MSFGEFMRSEFKGGRILRGRFLQNSTPDLDESEKEIMLLT